MNTPVDMQKAAEVDDYYSGSDYSRKGLNIMKTVLVRDSNLHLRLQGHIQPFCQVGVNIRSSKNNFEVSPFPLTSTSGSYA